MCILVEEIANCFVCFWGFQDSLIWFANYFWSLLNSFYLIFKLVFCKNNTVWSVWLNGWVFVYELSVSGFESSCSHLNFRFRACFEQGVPWHSDIYRVWIHSETCTWHGKNIQSQIKQFSFFIMQTDCNGYRYHTFLAKAYYFPLMKVRKTEKKKLTLILFYCLYQETWLSDSLKSICINQSRLQFLSRGKIEKCLT